MALQPIPANSEQVEKRGQSLHEANLGSFNVIQRTGTSTAGIPSVRATNKSSTSKLKPSRRCRGKMRSAASRRKSLKPHCVSSNGKPVIRRMILLKMIAGHLAPLALVHAD